MRLVYVAGPYRAPSQYQVIKNIEAARDLGVEVRKLGAGAVVPHCNSAFLEGVATDEHFLAEGLELLGRCDAVILVPGWEKSQGTLREMLEAEAHMMPVFRTLDELKVWLRNNE